MSETFPTETQLFRAYEVVFEALLNGLAVAVVLLLIAAIVLIILCCRELKRTTRPRDTEGAATYKECLENSKNENTPRQRGSPAAIHFVRADRPPPRTANESVENVTEEGALPVWRNSRFRSFMFKLQKQRNPQ